MARLIMKFGGTSLADAERIRAAAQTIARAASDGHQVVAVLSAQGHMTDELVQKAEQILPSFPPRELDMLLSVGEQISVSLCAAALAGLHCPAVSLTGWQAGLLTDSRHTQAEVLTLCSDRIERELAQGKVVLVAGFQGMDAAQDITTLGRGGSDTTAVALAVLLGARRCVIYTDVDGVFTADPRTHPEAEKLDYLTYDQMLALAAAGAQVLHERCVRLAKAHGLPIEVRSAFHAVPGTIVGP